MEILLIYLDVKEKQSDHSENGQLNFLNEKSNEIVKGNQSDLMKKNSLVPEIESEISSPALVTALSDRLEKAVSIDNGVMHMMSLSQVPMIVLFGPTNSKKFAPSKNNIKILDSKTLYNDHDINKITIEDVLKFF